MSSSNFVRNLTEVASTASAWAQANIVAEGTILTVNMSSLKLIDSSYRESLLSLAVETAFAGLPNVLDAGQKLESDDDVYSVCETKTLAGLAKMIYKQDIAIKGQYLVINLRQLSLIVEQHRNCVLGLAVSKAYALWVEMASKPTVDETVAEIPVEASAETAVEASAETAVEIVAETPVEASAETAETAETTVEVVAEAPVETSAEIAVETSAETAVEIVAEIVAEIPVEASAEIAETPVEIVAETPVEASAETAETAVEASAETAETAVETVAGAFAEIRGAVSEIGEAIGEIREAVAEIIAEISVSTDDYVL